jgi:hypothetical protein
MYIGPGSSTWSQISAPAIPSVQQGIDADGTLDGVHIHNKDAESDTQTSDAEGVNHEEAIRQVAGADAGRHHQEKVTRPLDFLFLSS